MSFKSHFNESIKQKSTRKPKLDGYSVPKGPMTKFKVGDIVLVHIPQHDKASEQELIKYFRVYHPALALPYMDKAGTVKLYKQGGIGASAKYGVEFEDGNIIPINSTFLIGPFASIETANRYKGKKGWNVSIEASDMAGFDPDSTVEVDHARETSFKEQFVNKEMGFEWLETPIVVKYRKFDVYVMAYKRNKVLSKRSDVKNNLDFLAKNDSMDRLDNPSYPQYDNCFVFCKVINKLTKKLQKTQVISSLQGNPGWYFIQAPELSKYFWNDAFEGPFVKDYTRLYQILMVPFNGTTRQNKEFKKGFAQYEDEDLIKTGYDHFKHLYNIQDGQSTINSPNVRIQEEYFGPYMKEITKYTILGECLIHLKDSTKKVLYVPQKARELCIAGQALESLENVSNCVIEEKLIISSNLKNFRGFPSSINNAKKSVEFRGDVTSLEGIPDKVYCDLTFTSLTSFVGARNCVCQGNVIVRHFPNKPKADLTGFFKEAPYFTSWSIKQEDLDAYTKYRDLEDKHPELEGIFS